MTASPNPTTPTYPDNVEWITAYFVIHMMSDPSRCYAYLLWSIVALVSLTVTILHWSGMTGGIIGAYWMKWALRRRTFRQNQTAKITGEPSHPISLPSNGQLLSLLLLLASTLVLCFVGPDYIAPGANIFSFKRDVTHVARATAYDESLWYQYQPQYTISKAWWTSGGRAGIIAFALIPLCVLLALKAPPFALFANRFTTQLHFDKLAWLHRWSGRLIWLVTAIHVALWSVQLGKDHRAGAGGVAFRYAWQYDRFIYAWIAFCLLTLLILCSMSPLRKRHYETFYYLHIFLFVSFTIMSALHHPPLWWWCWGSLAMWIGERFWRATWWLYINGFGRMSTSVISQHMSKPSTIEPAWGLNHIRSSTFTIDSIPLSLAPNQDSDTSDRLLITHGYYPPYSPPPGYAHAELLSGRTVRLTYISPGYRSWAPGQYFLLNIPSISKFVSHPFTCATICDEQAPTDIGRTMIFLIRTKAGWTKTLWDTLIALSARSRDHIPGENLPHGTVMPLSGVLLRMYVDGPFGSSVRSRWESHSTVVIVAGGSGVSFGLSVLEYVCLCLAGRDGKYLGGRSSGWGMKRFLTHRVRFVWLVREFSHIQWAASVLRHCMAMIPAPGLLVNIFVTNFKAVHYNSPNYSPSSRAVSPQPDAIDMADNRVAHSTRLAHQQRASDNDDTASYVDLTAYTGVYGDEEPISVDLGLRENYTLDLTNFDGECDSALPGEDMLSRRVKKAGMMRREKSRTVTDELGYFEGPRPHTKGNSLHARRVSAEGLLTPTWHPAESDLLSAEVDLGSAKATSLDIPWSLTHTPHARSPLSPHPHSSRPSPLALNIEAFPQSEFIGAATAADIPHSAVSAEWDATSDASSVRALIHEVGKGARGEEVSLVMDQQEVHDVTVVSEYARLGKPKLDRILADEVQHSQGSIIVACCGPTSLDAMVRKSIAIQIDPRRLQLGDMRGSISLVSEEFQY